MDHRSRVGALLVTLFAITYLDRVCISVAGPRMQADLGIDAIGWGWVTGMFTLSYCLFEIPAGMLGDRIGPRRVLTRIVLWWSAFTALTGTVTSYVPLLITRFLFGAGEAGAFPNSSIVVARWFKTTQRATISGLTLSACQIGGGLSPLLVVPIQMRYGWRAAFFVFGAVGVIWSAIWYAWFRDTPEERAGQSQSTSGAAAASHSTHPSDFPWKLAFRDQSVMALFLTTACYAYVYNFFQTWFHTFLVKGRGFSEANLLLSTAPYVLAMITNFAGGAASDALVRKLGLEKGRRLLGVVALSIAGLAAVAVTLTHGQIPTIVLLSVIYGAITFQQSGVFGVCLDIGQKHAGTVVGMMNTSAQAGGLLGSVLFGYIVQHFASYDAPFVPMAAALFLGALLWFRIDASQEIGQKRASIPVQLAFESE